MRCLFSGKQVISSVGGEVYDKKASMLSTFFSKVRLRALSHLGHTHLDCRRRISFRYLQGCGLEVGALHEPTPVSPGVKVRYVDRITTQQCVEKFPELNLNDIVNVDIVGDGFSLDEIEERSQDFLIAHHVLEHSDNVLLTLTNWCRVLRSGGILYFSVPIAEKCFDRGRPLTSWEHFLEDFQLFTEGGKEVRRKRNEPHYWDWVNYSMVNMAEGDGRPMELVSEESKRKYVSHMLDIGFEIHFHAFSPESVRGLIAKYVKNIDPSMRCLRVIDNGGEVLVVMRKKG